MRIVQVVHGLPPHERAGTEILTLELSRALQARGHQVTIIARTFAPEREEFSLQEEQDGSRMGKMGKMQDERAADCPHRQ